MFIVPINSSIQPVESLFDKETTRIDTNDDSPSFSNVFKEVFDDVLETNRILEEDAIKLTMGEIDDLHTVYNNMTKAAVALETFVAIKNTALESYKSIQQITL